MPNKEYVIVTPARNEAEYIEQTIKAVTAQTVQPKRWVIVSDGSTDDTDHIVKAYADKFDFMELLRLESKPTRDFGSKVNAINAGYSRIEQLEFEYFGNLDADITFDADYYERIMNRFEQYPQLGIAGGIVEDLNAKGRKGTFYGDGVGCAVHFFRRQCYEGIGGYLPMRYGGEDTIAETMTRMQNWQVRTFPEIVVSHLRPRGKGMWNSFQIPFYRGVADYYMGYHPLFFLLKSISRFRQKPLLISTFLMLLGYLYSSVRRAESQVPPRVVKYLRREQMNKLKALFYKARSK
jgi:biofilm PGA synthesis N-glycosyltransferase PgaC